MTFRNRETAHREMIRRAAEEFERTFELPHLTLVENQATGEFKIERGEPTIEDGMIAAVGEISTNQKDRK